MSVIDDALRRAEEDGVPRVRTSSSKGSARPSPSPKPVRNSDVPQAWTVSDRGSRPDGVVLCLLVVLLFVAVVVGGGWEIRDSFLYPPMTKTKLADSDAHRDGAASSSKANPLPPVPVGEAAAHHEYSSEGQNSGILPTIHPPSPIVRSQPPADRLVETAPQPQPQVDYARRFTLGGVMLGGHVSLAIINGSIVEAGQRIDGAVVVSIARRSAVLEMGGQRFRIPLSVAPG